MQVTFESTDTYTLEQFFTFLIETPDREYNRYELIHERIVISPPASYGHSSAEGQIGARIGSFVLDNKSGKVFGSSGGFVLPSGDVVQPDFAFIATERLQLQNQTKTDFIRVVPTLVIEILSPSTARQDWNDKKTIYERNGIEEYWVVDTANQTITVFHLVSGRFDAGSFFESSQDLASSVLPGFQCRVSELF